MIKKGTKKSEITDLLPLSNDYVFKRIFGKYGNEKLLKSLLETILKIKIDKIIIKNSEIPKNQIEEKASILDIRAELNDNISIDIEMQIGNKKAIERRLVTYGAKIISDDLKASESYDRVKDVSVICITNEDVTKRNTYFSRAEIKYDKIKEKTYVDMGYKEDKETFTDMTSYYIIELEKFKKKRPKTGTMLEKWLYLIGGDEKMIEEYKKEEDGVIKEAIDELQEMSANEKERIQYESRLIGMMDYNTDIKFAKEEGETIGEKKRQKIGKKRRKIVASQKNERRKTRYKSNKENNRTKWRRNRQIITQDFT